MSNFKKEILIKLIMTQQCNRKCDGCDRSFDISQTFENIDKLIFLLENFKSYDNFNINLEFFGGDPLLKYDMIKYFIYKINKDLGIKYSIYTDGVILDYEKFIFLKNNNFYINVFVDPDRYNFMLDKFFLKDYDFTMGVMVSPPMLDKAFYTYKDLFTYGYRKFRILPDYFLYEREKDKIEKLSLFFDFIKKTKVSFTSFSHISRPYVDYKFIFNTDGNFYSDIGLDFWYFIEFSEFNLVIPRGSAS